MERSSSPSRFLIPGLNTGLISAKVFRTAGSGAAPVSAANAGTSSSCNAAEQQARDARRAPAAEASKASLHRAARKRSASDADAAPGQPPPRPQTAQRSGSSQHAVMSSKALPPNWAGRPESVMDQYAAEALAALSAGARRAAAAAGGEPRSGGALGEGGRAADADGAPAPASLRQLAEGARVRGGSGAGSALLAYARATVSGDGARRVRGGAAGSRGAGYPAARGGRGGASPRRSGEGEGLEEEEDALLSHVLLVSGWEARGAARRLAGAGEGRS